MNFFAFIAKKRTHTTETSRFAFLALGTLGFSGSTERHKNVLDDKEVVNIERFLEARHAILGQRSCALAGRTAHMVLRSLARRWLDTALAKDVKALEKPGLGVGLVAVSAYHFFFCLLQGLRDGGSGGGGWRDGAGDCS